ncbi:Gas vesicle protein K [Enhydrobacter aerosaccus]|uniref:Gas vesicle protein K n=1 Tax=Enhydrobacter aerosaccus TaxID=225324 RepID=A0A1T4LV46_9HYPH|nr:gas vesicle protein K [Enhydrobacter aerosaccus]SJZ58506.1 Gas vesicle protein K [Enhydrobacter aerosaccus]
MTKLLEAKTVDPDKAGDDLVKLVLALVETLRQLVERQAIRRVDSGVLNDDEVERLGLALLRLEEKMSELKAHFGFGDEELTLKLGSLGELARDV